MPSPTEAEFQQRFAGRYFGKYRARVTDVDDPRSLGRILAVCPVVSGEDEVGWCWPAAASGGGAGDGAFWLPSIDDFVWVEFEEGDPSRAIWSGGPWGNRDNAPMTPKHMRGSPDDEDVLMRSVGPIPPSSYGAEDKAVRGFRSKSGHAFEFDDTPSAERVQMLHKVGTRLEFTADGSAQYVVAGSARARVQGDHVEEYGGSHEQTVGGNRRVSVAGEESVFVAKNATHSYQNVAVEGRGHSASWRGNYELFAAGTLDIGSASQARFQSSGQMSFMVGQNFQGTVLDTFELGVSNATGLPTSEGLLLQAYNSKAVLRATDPTGLIPLSKMDLILDPLMGITMQAGTPGGIIQVTNTPLANIHLGGLGVSEPFVLGNQLATLLTTILNDLAAHQHPTGVGPSGPPLTFSVYVAEAAKIPTLLSLNILGA